MDCLLPAMLLFPSGLPYLIIRRTESQNDQPLVDHSVLFKFNDASSTWTFTCNL